MSDTREGGADLEEGWGYKQRDETQRGLNTAATSKKRGKEKEGVQHSPRHKKGQKNRLQPTEGRISKKKGDSVKCMNWGPATSHSTGEKGPEAPIRTPAQEEELAYKKSEGFSVKVN